jgi:hypothetical protein
VKTSQLGRQAFMGVPGFIEHVFDASHVDDVANQAENFVVTDVDAAAADALAMHGGLRHYDTLNRQLWALSRQMPRQGYRFYERVLFERDDRPIARMPRLRKLQVARMRALLDDPFYRGFMVYVHPQGVHPIGFHIARLLDRNPRTPYAIELALHNLHTTSTGAGWTAGCARLPPGNHGSGYCEDRRRLTACTAMSCSSILRSRRASSASSSTPSRCSQRKRRRNCSGSSLSGKKSYSLRRASLRRLSIWSSICTRLSSPITIRLPSRSARQ